MEVLLRGTAVMEVRSLYGATAVMAVPLRPHCGLAQPADDLNMFKVSAVPPRTSAVLTVFGGATAINDGTTAEPLRNHDDNGVPPQYYPRHTEGAMPMRFMSYKHRSGIAPSV